MIRILMHKYQIQITSTQVKKISLLAMAARAWNHSIGEQRHKDLWSLLAS